MAEDKMMRLSQVARILNVGITTIVDHLSAKGFKVESNPNTKINSDQIDFLAKDFKSEDLKSSMAPKPVSTEKAEEVKEQKVKSDVDEILYFRSSPNKPAEESKTPPEAPKEETAVTENKLPGIKVVGKIDLNAKGPAAPAPKPVAPAAEKPAAAPAPEKPAEVQEAPKEVAPTPEPVKETPAVQEPKIEEKPKEVKVTEPAQEPEKAPLPAAEAPKAEPAPIVPAAPIAPVAAPLAMPKDEPKAVEADPTPDTKQPNIEPIVANNPKVPASESGPETTESNESKLIEARGEQLRGLRVIGKIELPSDKKKKDPVASSDSASDKKRRRKRKRIRDGAPAPAAGAAKPAGTDASGTTARSTDGTANKPASKPAGTPGASTGTDSRSSSARGGGRDRNKRGGKREEVSDKEVASNIKATMARMGGTNAKTTSRGKSLRRRDRADRNDPNGMEDEETKVLRVTEFVSANDLASLMDVTVQEVISVCMSMGMFVSINQRLDAEAITFIADEFGFEVAFISAEEEVQNDVVEEVDDEESLKERAPIVTIMGHVDHGKTSLLDYIRHENVASGEAGGITQHIGAYSVKTKTGKQVTFLDTPGHEAFTAMRARGAKVTDVVIIVIAADDSVMPQTREAINHAQVAGVPIVFAFSKVDKAGANTEKVREELANMNLLVEEWGGKYQTQEISSKSGLGIDELLEKVLLEAELLDLKANPSRRALGTVVEASLDKGRGYVTTILVQTGTLRVGDSVLAGAHYGKVKAMTDHLGRKLKSAGPSTPVQLLGLNGAPQAGDRFNVFENERDAREIATKREQIQREQTIRTRKHITLEEIGRRKAIGSFRELNLIVKGDVDGSVEALSDSLLQLSTSEVQVNIIHKAVGQISESDVNLAIASDAIIVGFQVRPSANAKKMAEQDQIEIRHYSVIYNAIEEIKDAMTGMLAPTIEEIITGNIEIREVFKISRIGTIAGCYVTDGYVKRNNKIRIIRDGIVLHTGDIDSLKRFKDDVQEVRTGYECGVSIKNYNDIEVGDIIESFEFKEVKRTML
ncbi:translation initiation factor IF-2 [Dyadobacter tibetensis]|uniref:translation initiation factor IF-2 n=1 Tax=Dyadobacter tibetensis TaxID=1211851 RepID=UPI00046FFC58|nr:translation initiation factor IF-2 [Dyadobacter tibetensis]